MPMPLSIYDLHGPTIITIKPSIGNHTSAGTSPVHTMPTIYHKLEHSIRNSPLDISFYKMSAADMIRYHYHLHHPSTFITNPTEDQFSSSSSGSFDSTTTSSSSSVSDVTTTTTTTTLPALEKSKKQSHRRLLREIRRLRSENTTLHNSLNILKEDLRHERESRQIAEQCHKKFFDESIDTHTRLELEIMDQQDQLLAYQSRLNDNTTTHSTTGLSNNNNLFNDDDDLFDDDDLLWGCEDMDCSNERRQCYDGTNSDFDMDNDDDDDDDDQSSYCDHDDDPRFEDLAVSYLRQALISNLTTARTNLEFDDLMLKHDPSPVKVLRTLADAFLGWIRETIHTSTATLSSSSSATSCTTTNANEKATCVARLMTTQVQDVFLHFWKNILERYVHNDEDQYQFLHQAERMLHHHPNQQQQDDSHYIVQNFHRLLVMLYKYDIVDADAVVHWWHDHHLPESHSLDSNGDNNNDDNYHDDAVADQLRLVTRKFVEWVDEEEEDDDDDDNNAEDLFANDDNDDDDDYQYDSELDDDEPMDGYLYDSGLLEPTSADDSNVSRPPIHPVERKKKSVTIQV